MSGPYDTSGDALRDAAHVYDASRRQERRGTMSQINEALLLAALASTGVEVGEFDRGIAGWLAGYEPETVQVVIGWVQRAHFAGNLGANWAHHVAASRTQAGAEAAEADVMDGLPWRVYGLPRPGDGGRPWLVNAFTTKRGAEEFAERHPEHAPLTIVNADEPAADADGGA